VQPRSIPRRFWAALCAIVVLLGSPRPLHGLPSTGGDPGPAWREAPAYVALFAPRLHRDAYRAYVLGDGLDAALRLVAHEPGALQAPGSWVPHPQLPADAFGQSGTYDHQKIARLYGSRRASVARGPHGHDELVDEMWTLISPYPSPDLERLEAGTLLIVLRIP